VAGNRGWIPAGTDVNVACPARVRDALLGGCHHFPIDQWTARRAVDDHLVEPMAAAANRGFLQRAVRHLLAVGVRQFLDLGSGIPTAGHVHEIVHGVDPAFPVVYVDVDPVAVAHGTAILSSAENAAAVCADLRDVSQVLAAPAVRHLIDFACPVGIVAVDVLHLLADTDDPAGVLGRYREAVPARSHLVVSHVLASAATPDPQGETPRSRAGISNMFAGWDLVRPGLVPMSQWYADGGDGSPNGLEPTTYLAGVARKSEPVR
jgi:hypothetical protein